MFGYNKLCVCVPLIETPQITSSPFYINLFFFFFFYFFFFLLLLVHLFRKNSMEQDCHHEGNDNIKPEQHKDK
jgi:hypothetical protein